VEAKAAPTTTISVTCALQCVESLIRSRESVCVTVER
jgi:hypothetical protein